MLIKRLNQELIQARTGKQIPYFTPGNVISVHHKTIDNRRANCLGICISRKNRGISSTFTVKEFVSNVNKQWPLYSPRIDEIKILDKKVARRSKLYYLSSAGGQKEINRYKNKQ